MDGFAYNQLSIVKKDAQACQQHQTVEVLKLCIKQKLQTNYFNVSSSFQKQVKYQKRPNNSNKHGS